MKQGTISYDVQVNRKISGDNDEISRTYHISIRLYDTDGFDATQFRVGDINTETIRGLEQAIARAMMTDPTITFKRLSETQVLPKEEE